MTMSQYHAHNRLSLAARERDIEAQRWSRTRGNRATTRETNRALGTEENAAELPAYSREPLEGEKLPEYQIGDAGGLDDVSRPERAVVR